jgi:uncharacterized C2H2 Zn-finger protein
LEGPHIDGVDDDNDEEWVEEKKKNSKITARKKTGGAPPPPPPQKRSRGRPSKSSASTKPKLVVPPPKSSSKDPAFKSPADKSREATCQLCRKVFPSAYLAEHMNVSHNAVQGQPCLICGKVSLFYCFVGKVHLKIKKIIQTLFFLFLQFFENSYKAIKHLLTHVPEAAFGCSRCHDTFKTAGKKISKSSLILILTNVYRYFQDERNQHTSSHLDSEKKLECPKCTQSFTSLLLLNKHEAQKHRQTKSFLCSICAKLLTGKDEVCNT